MVEPTSFRMLLGAAAACLLVLRCPSVQAQGIQLGVRVELFESQRGPSGYSGFLVLRMEPGRWTMAGPAEQESSSRVEAEPPERERVREDLWTDAAMMAKADSLEAPVSSAHPEEALVQEPQREPSHFGTERVGSAVPGSAAPGSAAPGSVSAQPAWVALGRAHSSSGDSLFASAGPDATDESSLPAPRHGQSQAAGGEEPRRPEYPRLLRTVPGHSQGRTSNREALDHFGPRTVELLLNAVRKRAQRGTERLRSMTSRSRSAALLPQLRLMAGKSADQSLRYSPTADDPDRWLQAGGADLRYQAQATWDLDRVVFSRDELGVERFQLQRDKDTENAVREALRALFDWQLARLRARGELLTDEERSHFQLQAAQQQRLLDVLSDGWFSRHLARSRMPGQESP